MNREEVSRIVYEIIEEVERRDLGLEDDEDYERTSPDCIRQELDECGCRGRCLCSEMLEIVEERLGIIFDRSYQIPDEEYIDLAYSLVQKNENPTEALKNEVDNSHVSFGSQFVGCYLPLVLFAWIFVYASAPISLDIGPLKALVIAVVGLACIWVKESFFDKDTVHYTEHEKKVIAAYENRQNTKLA